MPVSGSERDEREEKKQNELLIQDSQPLCGKGREVIREINHQKNSEEHGVQTSKKQMPKQKRDARTIESGDSRSGDQMLCNGLRRKTTQDTQKAWPKA